MPQHVGIDSNSILQVIMPPPGHTPGDLLLFSFSEVYFSPLGTQKVTIPYPQAPDRPHIRFWLHLFYPYKRKTTRFHYFYERFPEFIERRIMDVIM